MLISSGFGLNCQLISTFAHLVMTFVIYQTFICEHDSYQFHNNYMVREDFNHVCFMWFVYILDWHFVCSYLFRYSKNNLGRMYPFGLRFNSSNADPMVAWSHGIQVAAINMQGNDRPVWIARALFSANGNCGYVKKPDLFLPGSNFDYEQISSLPPKVLLKVSK